MFFNRKLFKSLKVRESGDTHFPIVLGTFGSLDIVMYWITTKHCHYLQSFFRAIRLGRRRTFCPIHLLSIWSQHGKIKGHVCEVHHLTCTLMQGQWNIKCWWTLKDTILQTFFKRLLINKKRRQQQKQSSFVTSFDTNI